MTNPEIEKARLIYEAYGRTIFVHKNSRVPILSLKETLVVISLIDEARAALNLLVNHPEAANLENGGREIFNLTIRDLKGCVEWIYYKPDGKKEPITPVC